MGTRNLKKFAIQNPEILARDGVALFLAINAEDEIGTRQLLREYETSYPPGYGKQVTSKTILLLSGQKKNWLRSIC